MPFTPTPMSWLQGSLPWHSNLETVPSQGAKTISLQLPPNPNFVLSQGSLLG